MGLAPGAHGANRTGRIFTGDRSGDFLYAALYRVGLASQPTSESRNDGLVLTNTFVTCPVKCVPPDNKPSPAEVAACAPFLDAELDALLPNENRVFLALGALAFRATLEYLARHSLSEAGARPAFAHGKSFGGVGSRSWGATTSASRTRRPAGSRPPCSTRC